MRPFLRHHGLTLAYSILIFIISSIPSLKAPDIGLSFLDKILHMLEFGVLGVLLVHSFSVVFSRRRKVIVWTLITGVAYAGLDELHQVFVPGRECAWGDFVADSVGIVFSLILSVFILRRLFSNLSIFLLTFK